MSVSTALNIAEVDYEICSIILELDIYRTAKLFVDQHGEDAPFRVAERVDDLLEAGDTDGAVIWRATMRAIEELQRERVKR
jgi:hypothetical protein